MVSWHAQPGRFKCWLNFVAGSAFDLGFCAFDVGEPVAAEEQRVRRKKMRRMFERSEFGASRLTRAPQGIRPFGPDGGLGGSVFAYFLRTKSKAHQPAELAAQRF